MGPGKSEITVGQQSGASRQAAGEKATSGTRGRAEGGTEGVTFTRGALKSGERARSLREEQ